LIRVAVIGVGKFGWFHAMKYAAMPDVELTVVDTSLERAKEAGEEFSCEYADHYKKIKCVDFVSIATPNMWHFEVAKHFLEAGVNVLLEKPMTGNRHLAGKLIRYSNLSGAKFMVDNLELFNSVYLGAKKTIVDPKFIYSYRSCAYRSCRIDTDIVLDMMIHDICLVLDLVDSNIKSVDAIGTNDCSNTNDHANAIIRFENGCVANLVAERICGRRKSTMSILWKGGHTELNLLEKTNDTLKDQIVEFLNGSQPNCYEAESALDLALDIMERINDGKSKAKTPDNLEAQ
jgi:predicted dehydrogenase